MIGKVGSNARLLIQNYAHKGQRNKGPILYEEDSKLVDKAQAPNGLFTSTHFCLDPRVLPRCVRGREVLAYSHEPPERALTLKDVRVNS